MRNDDAARGEDTRLIVRVLYVPLNGDQAFPEFLQLLQQFRRLVRVVRVLPAALDRLGRGHPRRQILEQLLEDTYFLQASTSIFFSSVLQQFRIDPEPLPEAARWKQQFLVFGKTLNVPATTRLYYCVKRSFHAAVSLAEKIPRNPFSLCIS